MKKASEETKQYLNELQNSDSLNSKAHLGLLINSAGFLHDIKGSKLYPERKVEEISMENLSTNFGVSACCSNVKLLHGSSIHLPFQTMQVNTFRPMLMVKHFTGMLTKSHTPVLFANISARVGSVEDNRIGGWYSYRASKAAQNQFTKTLSIELKRRNREAICVALHPGTVDTNISEPFHRNVCKDKLFSSEYSAEKLLEVMHNLVSEDTGSYLDYAGKPILW